MKIVDKLHRERVSQRGIARVTGISRPTMIRWLRKKSLTPHRGDDPAVERSTKRVVGWAVGDRSATTCRKLWVLLPTDYRKRGIFYTDEYCICGKRCCSVEMCSCMRCASV
jgi:hypothetical protein